MKRYLEPKILRRGSPVLLFVKNDGPNSFWLGVYHGLMAKPQSGPYGGMGWEYEAASEQRISETLFRALLAEVKLNKGKYKERK